MTDPYADPSRHDRDAEDAADTVRRGVNMGCLSMVLGGAACFVLVFATWSIASSARTESGPSPAIAGAMQWMFVLFWLLPLVAPVVLAVRYFSQGRGRAAKGALASILVAFAIALLLAGACFGLVFLSNGNFR